MVCHGGAREVPGKLLRAGTALSHPEEEVLRTLAHQTRNNVRSLEEMGGGHNMQALGIP